MIGMANETYILTLEDTGDGPPAPIRLRRLLKLALRYMGFRCIDVRETPSIRPPGGGQTPETAIPTTRDTSAVDFHTR
jgi:hypothetical protein